MDSQLPQENEVVERLKNLEQQNKRLTYFIIILFIIMISNIVLLSVIMLKPRAGKYQVVFNQGILYRVDTTTGSTQLLTGGYNTSFNEIGYLPSWSNWDKYAEDVKKEQEENKKRFEEMEEKRIEGENKFKERIKHLEKKKGRPLTKDEIADEKLAQWMEQREKNK